MEKEEVKEKEKEKEEEKVNDDIEKQTPKDQALFIEFPPNFREDFLLRCVECGIHWEK